MKKTSEIIKQLNESRYLMSEVSMTITNLSEENKDLRVMLWRMIEKHGAEVSGGKLDDEVFDKILSSDIYLDDDLNIQFSNFSMVTKEDYNMALDVIDDYYNHLRPCSSDEYKRFYCKDESYHKTARCTKQCSDCIISDDMEATFKVDGTMYTIKFDDGSWVRMSGAKLHKVLNDVARGE